MRWLLLALLTIQAATCGQKGPLRLPEEPSGAPAEPASAAAVIAAAASEAREQP